MWQDGIPRAHGLNLSNVDIMQSNAGPDTWRPGVINCHMAPCSPSALTCYDLIWMHNCSPHLCMVSSANVDSRMTDRRHCVYLDTGISGHHHLIPLPPLLLNSQHSPHSGSRINWSNVARGENNCPVVTISQMTTDCNILKHFKTEV